ncbi:PAP/OAS1 substrate-binding domain-containing protein, partial [Fomitiporia mediterranea MF3/22]|uniref:PAP/OAS1 substrate-binding domain-containing protein n=1 Tax=Fomitiporia mediterranea (strain MF3/22) TaxID=694068 RepID=UPI00044073A4
MTSYARNNAPVNFASGSHQHQHQQHPHQHYGDSGGQHTSHSQRRQKFVAELSQCLLDFVIQLLPTVEELAVKEDVRKLLERLIRTIEPESRLLSFGSTANGFSLRNSDMDMCCLIDSDQRLSASDLVTMVGDLLERETKFHVKPLPHARIPIVKLSLDPSPGLPLGIACDIGFENRLALENTRLLLCYSMVDPTRVRTLVLFLKVWSKRRKINSPYEGTLSSYGYVLLVIYFLVHVKNPPVLPNLQQIPPLHPIPAEEHHLAGRNIWFFDDIELLRQRWKSQNSESVAELLIDFFRYYAKDFTYNSGVASIRAGLLKKESKGWQGDNDPRFKDGRERNRLCIEDPFETDYNVARCVTRDGLYVIRGEFMRASRILQHRQERGYQALAQLCEERDDSTTRMNAAHNTIFVPPRLSFPPQTPYSIGSNSFRPNGAPARDRLSPPRKILEENAPPDVAPDVQPRSPPEHMAPKRTQFTSPPPPEAPEDDVASFESRLSQGLSLATAPTDAREQERAYMSSSSNSEILSDDGDVRSDVAQEDDVKSVRSFT